MNKIYYFYAALFILIIAQLHAKVVPTYSTKRLALKEKMQALDKRIAHVSIQKVKLQKKRDKVLSKLEELPEKAQ